MGIRKIFIGRINIRIESRYYMKTTGVVRRIDGLGRIVVPKEIRRTLRIRDGEPLEIFVDKDFIALKKYSPMTDFRTLTQILVDSVYDSISLDIFITDRDQCVAASNSIKKEYYNNPISSYLEKVLADRKKVSSPVKEVELSRNHTETISYTLNPIIVNGDVIGLVGLTSPTNITDSDEKIASFITEFLCKNIEE